jgi:5'-3' exonuclease
MDRYVFVDADSILFRCVYGDNISNNLMMKRYRDKLDYIKTSCFANNMYVAIKGFDNFRTKIYPEYKANRPTLEDHIKKRLNFVAQYALEQGAVQSNGWEADDQVRAWAWEAQQEDLNWIIAGIDKDLLQIPGTHFNYGGTEAKPLNENDKWHFITQEEGDYRFAAQLLTGDRTDNIIGINRCGPKKAEKALSELKTRKEIMSKVIEMYKEEWPDKWEEQLILNCHMIYMRRWLDDEFDYREWLNG